MKRSHAFTLVEILVVVAILALLLAILIPTLGEAQKRAKQLHCGTNLRGLHTAMTVYASGNDDSFPIAGDRTAGGSVVGFAFTDRSRDDVTPDELTDNSTASWWLLVREGYASPEQFVCKSTRQTADPLEDASGDPVDLLDTWDFLSADHLSYSTMNPYHATARDRWASGVRGDWVMLADDNNCNDADRHTLTRRDRPSAALVRRSANGVNHGGVGQNFIRADGSRIFASDPFVGPSGDNAYADDTSASDAVESAAPPTLDNDATDNNPQRNVMLIPVTGNGGGAGSLDPND